MSVEEFSARVAELKTKKSALYLAMLAGLYVLAGFRGYPPEGYTRGDFKRAVKVIRAAPKGTELASTFEAAVTLIREDWLGRTANDERGSAE